MTNTYIEMKNQYEALRKTYDYILSQRHNIKKFFTQKNPTSINYIGCGSGYCLCTSAELQTRVRLGLPATAMPAGDVMLNFGDYSKLFEGSLVYAPSRSGSTSEVIKAIESLKSTYDVPVFAVSCAVDSALSRISDYVLEIPWAYDDSVCQTRTVTNLYTANLLVTAILADDEGLIAGIDRAISAGDDYMQEYEELLKAAAAGKWSDVVILADGEMQGIASEGAMAFAEIANVSAQYYHLLDVRHGPMTMINENTLVVAALNTKGPDYQKALLQDIRSRGASIVISADADYISSDGTDVIVNHKVSSDNAVSGIPFIFIIQMLAHEKAVLKGLNPDNPDGITLWVKL